MYLDTTSELNLNKIHQVPFPEDQYVKEIFPKHQICLHHSAGWDNARGMFAGWAQDKARIATCCAVSDDGTIWQAQGFSSKFYAWHINPYSKYNQLTQDQRHLVQKNSKWYEQSSVGVEILNWGPLSYHGGKFHTWVNDFGHRGRGVTIPEKKVVEYEGEGWRGHRYYERYTDEEMQSTYELLKYWMKSFDIPCCFSHELFEIRPEALKGERGVFTHASYRTDKFDCHPQKELIQVLDALKS